MKIQINNSKKELINCASVDRIDNSLGYIKGNIQWLHKDINLIKNDFKNGEVINYARFVTNPTIYLSNRKIKKEFFMQTRKLFLIGEYDREGAKLALEIPDEIRTYPDAVDYLRPILSSDEFIELMHKQDYDEWLYQMNEDREEDDQSPLKMSDFKLDSVEYACGQCRWIFLTEDEEELVITKYMDFATNIIS